jgi:transitional endoplasmic reticulum ATPase
MSEPRSLPAWAEDLRRRYLRGEATMFVLHGNVYDVVLYQKRMVALTEFLTDVLLKESKETIAVYNVATGVRFAKRSASVTDLEDLLLASEKQRIFAALERLLVGSMKAALIMDTPKRLRPPGTRIFKAIPTAPPS